MNRFKCFFNLLLLAAIVFSGQVINADELPDIKFNSLEDDMPLRDDLRTGELDNGLKYFILKNQKPENRVSLRMPVKVGSIDETDKQKGMAHFVEHMCFNGTEDFPKMDLINFLEKTGVKFGAHLNAYTSFDETVYMLELPADDNEILEKGIQVLENWAHKVSFTDEGIDAERGVVIEEARLRGGAQQRMFEKHKEVAFWGSKYKDRLPIGDTTLLRNSDHEEFRRFYKKWYRPDLMSVIVVGDIDVDKMETLVKKYFDKIELPDNPEQPEEYRLPENPKPLASIATDKELQFPVISFSWRRPGFDQQGTYKEYRDVIIDRIATGMINERLAEKALESDPPYQFAQSSYNNNFGALDFDLFALSKGDSYKNAASTLLTEAIRASEYGITESEFERQKESLLNSYKSSYNERNKTESSSISMELVRHFLENEPVPGISYEYAFVQKMLPVITKEEVNQRLKEYIDDDNIIATISLPETVENVPNEDEVLALYKSVSGSDIAAYEDIATDQPLFDKDLTPGEIVSEEDMEFDVKKLTLSNGAEVYYKNTDFSDDEILFRAVSPGGTSLFTDEEFHTGRFIDNIINSSGISEFDESTIRKMMSSKNFNVRPNISSLNEGFRGNSSIDDFETSLQMLHLYFTDPRVDKDAFESWKSKEIDAVVNSKRNPASILYDSATYILSGYNSRSLPLDEKYFDKVNYNKVLSLYKNRFKGASDFKFIFVGNTDKVDLKAMVKKYIASLPSGKTEDWKDLGNRTPEGNIEKEYKKGIDQKSNVILYFTNDDFEYTPENRHKVQSFIKVFSIRLREQLREEKGGVYGVGAWPSMSKYPVEECNIGISFGCDPGRVDELVNDVHKIINELRTELISDENMTKIKETQRREFETAQKENNSWISWIYSSLWYNESLSRLDSYPELIENLSKEDIKDVANKYLANDNYKKFVLYPEGSN